MRSLGSATTRFSASRKPKYVLTADTLRAMLDGASPHVLEEEDEGAQVRRGHLAGVMRSSVRENDARRTMSCS
jgi:hypothetical protein